MDNRSFKRTMWNILENRDFKKGKKFYYKDYGELYLKIDVQKSDYSDGWYLNYRIIIRELHPDNDLNSEKYDLFGRFLFMINEKETALLNVGELDETELEKLFTVGVINVDQVLEKKGLKGYCNMYPDKVTASTVGAQEFMLKKGYIDETVS